MTSADGPTWVRVPVEGGDEPYYWNPATQAVCWNVPNDLEVVWAAQKTLDGRFYFWNMHTRETTWDMPLAQKKPTGTSFKLPLSPNGTPPCTGSWQFEVVAQGRGVPRGSERGAGSQTPGPGLSVHPPRAHLPDEWVEVRRPNQQAYYWNFRHNLSTSTLPLGAGAKWRSYSNSEGHWYYINTESGQSAWVVPGMACDSCEQLFDSEETLDCGWFQVGAAVILRNLESKASARYNDQLGQVFGYQDGRVIVVLPDCLGGTMLAVRVKNLSPLVKGTIVELKGSSHANLSVEVGTIDQVHAADICYSVKMRDNSIKSVKPTRLVARSRLWNIDTAQVPTWSQWRKEQDCLFIDSTGQHRRYSLHLPQSSPALVEGSMKASPMLIYLHGTGGTSFFKHSKRLLKSIGLQFAASNFFVVSPCCDWTWKETPKAWVTELITALRAAEWVDHHRIYLTGCSMGGMGTWEVASARPDLYAAIAPVAAHHKAEHESCLASSLQKMPTFVVHSESDETCPFKQEEALWTLLFDTEKNPYMQVNVARHLGHGTMYERAYCDDTVLYDWLLQHAR